MTNPLDEAWASINALGGDARTAIEFSYNEALRDALAIIEELGGMDPARRARMKAHVTRTQPAIATETGADCVLVPRETLGIVCRDFAQALGQWKMYAEMEDRRDFSTDDTAEADLFRRAVRTLRKAEGLSDD